MRCFTAKNFNNLNQIIYPNCPEVGYCAQALNDNGNDIENDNDIDNDDNMDWYGKKEEDNSRWP